MNPYWEDEMVQVKVLYIEARGGNSHKRDPLLEGLKTVANMSVTVFAAESPKLKGQVVGHVNLAKKDGYKCVVIISAFLAPKQEWVVRGRWDPGLIKLRYLLNPGSGRCLRSLYLLWDLWQEVRCGSFLFVTTGEVQTSPQSRHALAAAYCDGSVCRIYGWLGDELRVADLLEEISQCG